MSTWRFEDCELNLAAGELWRGGARVSIEPKALDLLTYLLEHRERVVNKHELQDALWPEVVVTEASLARTVMKARKAVGDDASQQRVIQTQSKRGYRFIAPVEADGEQQAEPGGLSPIQFVPQGDVHIAWRTLGDRHPPDILFVPGFVSHLDFRYRIRPLARFDQRLSRHGRLITFDKRGVGLSDRIGYAPEIDHTVDDMLAVVDAAGAEQVILFGVSESGPATALFAARYPERTRAVIMYGAFARGLRSPDYRWGTSRRLFDRWVDALIRNWGGPSALEYFAPDYAAEPEIQEAWARYLRGAATPGSIRGILEALRDIDVRPELPRIQAPTLVLHRDGDRIVRVGAGEDMASRIPGARFVRLDGNDHWWFLGDSNAVHREVEKFLKELPPV